MLTALRKHKHFHSIILGLVTAASCFLLFFKLGEKTLLTSDESIYAVAAQEMLESGDLLVTTFLGEPDHYNCKPPLGVMTIAVSMAVFGQNEFAVRLPSALAALATIFLLYWFAQRFVKQRWAGYLAMLVLATSPGYVGYHISRNGDTDALLILFSTAYIFSFYGYLKSKENRSKHKFLIAGTLALALAFLTKGLAAFVPLPALLIYSLYAGKFVELLKSWKVWASLLTVFGIAAGYIFLREAYDPGYITALTQSEWGQRFTETYGGHQQPFYFYILRLAADRFNPHIWVLTTLFIVTIFKSSKRTKDVLWFCFIVSGWIMLVFSLAQTKMAWYDGPIYPFLALAVGVAFVAEFQKTKERTFSTAQRSMLVLIVLIIIFAGVKVHNQNSAINYYPVDREGALLRELKEEHPQLSEYKVIKPFYDKRLMGVIAFYGSAWADEGYSIDFAKYEELKAGDKVAISASRVFSDMQSDFEIEELHTTIYGKVYLIKSVKR